MLHFSTLGAIAQHTAASMRRKRHAEEATPLCFDIAPRDWRDDAWCRSSPRPHRRFAAVAVAIGISDQSDVCFSAWIRL